MTTCTAHNGSGQDIHDHDIRMGRPCSLCSVAPMTDAEAMAEARLIALGEMRR
jgi:hypothetical protein